jgi:hypothetical protein
MSGGMRNDALDERLRIANEKNASLLDQVHIDNAGDRFRVVKHNGGFERVNMPALLAEPDEEC